MRATKLSTLAQALLKNPVIKTELNEVITSIAEFQDGVPSAVKSKVTARKVMAGLSAEDHKRLADILADEYLGSGLQMRCITNIIFPQVAAEFLAAEEKAVAKLDKEHRELILQDKTWTEMQPTYEEIVRLRKHMKFLNYMIRNSH